MMVELPDPLTPADCDLRGLEYMPLLGHNLFASDFNARASDAEWRAAMTLWWASWQQVPAASLPDDDVILCKLADLGRDMKAWRRVKAMALHNFVLCADGRLYHPTVAKQALLAWDKRVKERERKAQWRAKKMGQDADVPQDNPVVSPSPSPSQERGRDADVPADGTRRDGTNPPTPLPVSPGQAAHHAMCQRIADEAGMLGIPPDHRLLREWLALPEVEFERDILPVVRRVAAEVRAGDGRTPFKFRLFDAAIREQHARDAAEIERLRRSRAAYAEPAGAAVQ